MGGAAELRNELPGGLLGHLLVVALSHLPLIWSSDPLLSPKGVNYEVAALMSVKSKMRCAVGAMDGWDINSVDPCTWSMVGCSPDGFVISLEMASNGFIGTLSPSIGNLSHLQTMLLQNNRISGPIPPEIGKLSKLRTLDLSGNQFIGQIPSSLGSLINLNYLRLNGNNLSGPIPGTVAGLSGLSFLDLSFNNLSGPTPRILAKDYSVAGNKFLCTPSVLQGCVEVPVPVKEMDASSRASDHQMVVAVSVTLGSALAVSLMVIVCWHQWNRCPVGFALDEQQDYEFDIGHLKRFTFRELVMATDNFMVYKGLLRNGAVVAVKRLKDPNFTGELQFQTEVEMIGLALHRNLLRLLLVYPFMPNGSVADQLRETILGLEQAHGHCPRSCTGLLYLHEQCNPKIIHRDVKAANILLDQSFEAVVGDFGLAKLLDRRDSHVTTAVRGTVGHIAPEYLATGQSSEKTDVFGFGILLLELVTGGKSLSAGNGHAHKGMMFLDWVRGAYEGKRLETLVDKELCGSVDEMELENAVRLALLCTQALPGLRPKMSEIVKELEGGSAAGAPGEESMAANLCERSCSFSRGHEYPHRMSPPSSSNRLSSRAPDELFFLPLLLLVPVYL
ncbi:unnamed protein product [Spirodela intermedia]|uniref:Protein kinase domain-containing protein n=1 Tax=Spirodela intermedia TaxID=51605 RepID=A0A7I8J6G0_SPIIN|nr:unnamed protein product [Spirodela intermedia]CAA6665639.1 unnamed protein product [Spirodela intermedia]